MATDSTNTQACPDCGAEGCHNPAFDGDDLVSAKTPDAIAGIAVVFVRDGDHWYAQCLDYDIAAQGDSIQEAAERFGRTWTAQLECDRDHGVEPIAHLSPAPSEYWDVALSSPRKP